MRFIFYLLDAVKIFSLAHFGPKNKLEVNDKKGHFIDCTQRFGCGRINKIWLIVEKKVPKLTRTKKV